MTMMMMTPTCPEHKVTGVKCPCYKNWTQAPGRVDAGARVGNGHQMCSSHCGTDGKRRQSRDSFGVCVHSSGVDDQDQHHGEDGLQHQTRHRVDSITKTGGGQGGSPGLGGDGVEDTRSQAGSTNLGQDVEQCSKLGYFTPSHHSH